MQKKAVETAKGRLSSMRAQVRDLEKSRNYDSAREHWYAFLRSSNSVFSDLEQGAKGFGKSTGWFREIKHQRKNDPLLCYLHHARNAYKEGVPLGADLDRQKYVFVEGGKPTAAVEEIVGNTGEFRKLADQQPNLEKVDEMRFYPDRLRLIRVKDRGVEFDPPTEHLGLPIDDVEPKAVARLMVQYIEEMIDEAEALVRNQSITGSAGLTLDPVELDAEGPVGWSRAPDRETVESDNSPDTIYPPEVRYIPPIPEQSPAPIMVEERGGKIARVSDRDSPLRATERDFNAWREPVIDHIQELTSGEFREGTNHSRARERLLAIGRLLVGNISEVKDDQFRIGYEIERLDGLVAAYRSGGDDMPELSAAVLEDLDRLRLYLKLGVDKFERWSEFQKSASDAPGRAGEADPSAVGEVLDQMADKMEQNAKYFDPELPRSYRFLAEAVKDRVGATKTAVYGAVRSVENVVIFLCQRALGIGKRTGDEVEKHISKVVAATLVFYLSDPVLKLSTALPHAWTWLKPLLVTLAKAGGS